MKIALFLNVVDSLKVSRPPRVCGLPTATIRDRLPLCLVTCGWYEQINIVAGGVTVSGVRCTTVDCQGSPVHVLV